MASKSLANTSCGSDLQGKEAAIIPLNDRSFASDRPGIGHPAR